MSIVTNIDMSINKWNPDYTKGFILVDVSYTVFYKFYALKNWYTLAHKEVEITPDYIWGDNPDFVEKFKKLYMEQLLKIAKKSKIPLSNLLFITDCKQSEIWRHEYTTTYKATRAAAHQRQGFRDYGFFGIVKSLIKEFITINNSAMFYCPTAEADDVICILTRYIRNTRSSRKPIYIIASDADYLQLCSKEEPVLALLTMKGEPVNYTDAVTQLLSKVLLGDSSDNISACNVITAKFPVLYSSKKASLKVTKSILKQLLDDEASRLLLMEQFQNNQNKFRSSMDSQRRLQLDEMDDDITVNGMMSKNQLIIDFGAIPFDLVNRVMEDIMSR
jgi:hypothetical protein